MDQRDSLKVYQHSNCHKKKQILRKSCLQRHLSHPHHREKIGLMLDWSSVAFDSNRQKRFETVKLSEGDSALTAQW